MIMVEQKANKILGFTDDAIDPRPRRDRPCRAERRAAADAAALETHLTAGSRR